ncbi:MAG TPA: hypothetical protein VFA20_29410 [Myxococcaceae bacterium]|nr:hypothetical protein [Myxococcaceae bacterium]
MSEPRQIIGFSGRPVHAATGWKPPIIYEAQADRAYLESRAYEVWSLDEVKRFEQERVVSLLPRFQPFRHGVTLVYAHDLFMHPEVEGSPIPAFETLKYASQLESYFTLLSEEEALDLYRTWADQLLKFGRNLLFVGESAELALATAMRARYCTKPKRLRTLRLEADALAFAALAVSGGAPERLLEDAGKDFSEEEVSRIEQRGTSLATERSVRLSQRAAVEPALLARDLALAAILGGSPRAEAPGP